MGETTNKVTAILIPPTKLHNPFIYHLNYKFGWFFF